MELDTLLWLNNKFGTADNQWFSGGFATQFNQCILQNIYDCYLQLDTKIKIKMLLTFLEIPLRNMEELKTSIAAIVDLADSDPNEWVNVAANIVRYYPSHHSLDVRLGKVAGSFQQTVQDICERVENCQPSCISNILPLECSYLNRAALCQTVTNIPTATKHFTMRRKPKSAALRAKITQKATDAANQRRPSLSSQLSATSSSQKTNLKRAHSVPTGRAPTVPHQNKVMKATLPKKTKLLDITEQPLGMREQKKRKKMLAIEASVEEAKQRKQMELQKFQSEDEKQIDATEVKPNRECETENGEVSVDSNIRSLLPTSNFETNQTESQKTESILLQQESFTSPDIVNPESTPSVPFLVASHKDSLGPVSLADSDSIHDPPMDLRQHNSVMQLHDSYPDESNNIINVAPTPSNTSLALQRELQMQQEQKLRLHRHQEQKSHQQRQQLLQQQEQQQLSFNFAGNTFQQQNHQQQFQHGANIPFNTPNIGLSHHMSHLQSPHLVMGMPSVLPSQQKKGLSLTREQMLAAQEMFRSANKVTRAEKALILGFMAGARDNPFPQQGPVITIKLSEGTEIVHQHDEPQTVFIEMLFEMNYETGHWRRLKRTRVVSQ